MKHLLFQTEHLAEEIVKRLEASANPDRNNPPDLTRDIFEVEVFRMKEMLELNEFDLVCQAVDYLIDEGKITFDPAKHELVLNEEISSADPDTTSPGPHKST